MIERIEERRKVEGLSKSAMYKASGTSSSAFSQWKTGLTKPAMKSVIALAECLHTTPQYLMFGIKESDPAAYTNWATLEQQELMRIISRLSPAAVNNLLGTARFLAALEASQAAKE